MTKREAIEKFVEREFHPIPLDWVQAVAGAKHADVHAWPMWGTMWLVDDWLGRKLMRNAVLVEECDEHAEITDGENPECDKCANYDEEMAGAYNIRGTAAYIYEIDGQYVMGINGAGWNFYDGVWDRLYDLLGLQWHDNEHENNSQDND